MGNTGTIIRISAIALLLLALAVALSAQSTLEELIGDASELPESSKMLQIHNRDVVAYYDLREINTPLKVKNFQKSEEYKQKLAQLEEIRANLYSGSVYAKTFLMYGFEEYNLKTRKIVAQLQCPGDLLSRKTRNATSSYYDDPKVFCGTSFPALVTVTLPAAIRNIGMSYYGLELQVSEDVASILEGKAFHLYLIGKISGARQIKIFGHDYWEGIQSNTYPAPTISKEAPVIHSFKLALVDPETDAVVYVKDYQIAK